MPQEMCREPRKQLGVLCEEQLWEKQPGGVEPQKNPEFLQRSISGLPLCQLLDDLIMHAVQLFNDRDQARPSGSPAKDERLSLHA